MLSELLLPALVGPVIGALGRAAVPGPDRLPWRHALAAGLAGALGGALLASVALGRGHGVTVFVVAVLFAAMLVIGCAAYRRARALPPE